MKSHPPIPSCSNENFCFHVGDYSFGFNGIEEINELGNHLNISEYRIHSSVLGVWFTVDPLYFETENYSPYSSMLGNPILWNDPDGDCPFCAILDYTLQVADSYSKQKSAGNGFDFFDMFVGDINFVSVGLSAIPGGGIYIKGLKALSEVFDVSYNKGIEVKPIGEIVIGKAASKYSKSVTGSLKQMSSAKTLRQANNKVDQAHNNLKKLEKKRAKNPNSQAVKNRIEKQKEKIKEAEKQQEVVQNAHDTFGHYKENDWKGMEKAVTEATKSALKEKAKELGIPIEKKEKKRRRKKSPARHSTGTF